MSAPMVKYHNDPPCQSALTSDGRCPLCGFIPDMQSIGLREESVLETMARMAGGEPGSVLTTEVQDDPDWPDKLLQAMQDKRAGHYEA